MNLTARQVELLNSTNPQDNAELLASLGGDENLLRQLVNMYGPGGSQFNATNYGHTSSSLGGKPDPMFWAQYQAAGIMDANGNMLKHQDNNGNWVDGPPGGSYSAATVDPSSSWSGVNASGGFAGGTGTSAPYGFNSQTGAPLSQAQLTAALGGGGSTAGATGGAAGGLPRPSGAGGPSPTQPGGTPLSTLGGTGGAVGGSTTPSAVGTGAGGGGSTSAGNSGNTGGFPMASASTYSSGTPYTPPSDVTTPFDFYNDEGYKFALGEGKKSIENAAAARGGLLSGNTLKSLANYQTGLASQYYGDAFNRQMQNKNFNQNVATDARNFNNSNNQFDATFNNNNRMWDTTFNNNNRIDARNFDYGAAINDRNFNEDQRRYDQGFNYNAATGDRNYDTDILKTLYGGGLAGSNSNADLAKVLATLLSSNTLTGAGAGAAGTVGGATSIQNLINQILGTLYTNRGATGGTTPGVDAPYPNQIAGGRP